MVSLIQQNCEVVVVVVYCCLVLLVLGLVLFSFLLSAYTASDHVTDAFNFYLCRYLNISARTVQRLWRGYKSRQCVHSLLLVDMLLMIPFLCFLKINTLQCTALVAPC